MRTSHSGIRHLLGSGALRLMAAGAVIVCASAFAPAYATGHERALPEYVPLWTLPPEVGGTDTADLGPAPTGAPVSARVYLAGRDPRGLAAHAAAVSYPGGPRFHHYLTAAQVQERFGPSGDQIAAIRSWVTAAGLDVTGVNAHYVSVSGTAAEAADAFGAPWHGYQVEGRSQQAPPPGARLTAPEKVASAVLTVAPIETGLPGPGGDPAPPAKRSAPTDKAAGPAQCSDYFGERRATDLPPAYGRTAPYEVCGYTPRQLRSAYGVPDELTGRGVTVAVVAPGRNASTPQTVETFARRHAKPLRPGQLTQIIPPGLDESCAPEGDFFSEDFQAIEAVNGMAPDADIVYLGARCDHDEEALPMLDELATVTDRHLAVIVSGRTIRHYDPDPSPGLIAAYEQIFEQGALQGIGFYNGTADHGDGSTCQMNGACTPRQTKPAISYPGGDPWVTAVGGTSLAVGADGEYQWETGWGSHWAPLTADHQSWDVPGPFTSGAGGGTSDVLAQPPYQRGVVPGTLSHGHGSTTPMRVVPDVAADADMSTGIRTGVTVPDGLGVPPGYHEYAFGGTSSATPLFAGMQADAQQAAGEPIGFANPVIYARHGTPAYHDVTDEPLGAGIEIAAAGPTTGQPPIFPTTPRLSTFGLDQSLRATPGYDDVTGVGTLTNRYFAAYRNPARPPDRLGDRPRRATGQ
jgi:subtilase family serine protease